MALDESHGVASLRFGGKEIGGTDFLAPFVTYEIDGANRTHTAVAYKIQALGDERHEGLRRARLSGDIPFTTADGNVAVALTMDFTLPARAPWLVADINVRYPQTAKSDLLHTVLQKLRRYLDLGWIEVAPFQLAPRLEGSRERPLRVWKHNYLEVTSPYDLDYAAINPKNANVDSFNHQVTAGWVAVSDRSRGLLIAENADVLSSFAFVPMRLRESSGTQRVLLNPFGSYYGKQMDYSHLGGNGLGTEIALRKGAQFRPNGPSYNGRTERFSLLIAPYEGDAPPDQLQRDAGAFFYPPAVVYLQTPRGVDALLPEDMRQLIGDLRRAEERHKPGPLPVPTAFLANPTDGAVDLVWDEPEDARIDGYEIAWKETDQPHWQSLVIEPARRHRVTELRNGVRYAFRVRAGDAERPSVWTEAVECVVGPVPPPQMSGELVDLGPLVLLKILYYSLIHAFRT